MNIYKATILVGLFSISGVMATGSEAESEGSEYELSQMEEGELSSSKKKVVFKDDKAEKMLSKLEEGQECSDCEPSNEKKTDIKELLLDEVLEFAPSNLTDDAKEIVRKKLAKKLKGGRVKRSWFGTDEDTQKRHEELMRLLLEATNESTVVAKKALKEQKKEIKTSQKALKEQKKQVREQTKQRKLAEAAADTAREALEKQGETLFIYKRTTLIGGIVSGASVALNIIQAYFNFTSDEG